MGSWFDATFESPECVALANAMQVIEAADYHRADFVPESIDVGAFFAALDALPGTVPADLMAAIRIGIDDAIASNAEYWEIVRANVAPMAPVVSTEATATPISSSPLT